MTSAFFCQDVNSIVNHLEVYREKFYEATVLITGATGQIGSMIIHVLTNLNSKYNCNIRIIAVGRNEEKGCKLEVLQGVKFLKHDVRKPFDITETIDYIFHCSAVTESSKMVANPVAVIDTELMGIKNVLELARCKKIKGMVYTSSMEVYGSLDKEEVVEEDQGYINLENIRSCYPQSKRMVEMICKCYQEQYDLPISIARLGMTFGAGCDINDTRVWAYFARCVIDKKDIALRTDGKSVTSVVYLSDAVSAMFLLLFEGDNKTYNVSTISTSILEIAKKLAESYNINALVEKSIDIKKLGYNNNFKWPLNTERVTKLGWKPRVVNIVDMFERLIN